MLINFNMRLLMKIFCLVLFLPKIKSECFIKYHDDIEIAPKFEKNIGKFKLRIPYSKSDKLNPIKLLHGETIRGSCETYFSPFNYETKVKESRRFYDQDYVSYPTVNSVKNQTNIVISCHGTVLYYNGHKLSDQKFSCMKPNWNIYSSKEPYKWCEYNQNSSTFLFAVEKATKKSILAAICYNIDQISLQTLVYNTTILQSSYLNKPIDMNATDMIPSEYLDENLWNFQTAIVSDLSKEILQKKLTEMSKTDQWLSLANYEVSLIVQDELLIKYLKTYENMLNIIWWHNLRVGNWRRFQDTLRNNLHNNSYELYIGTSGVAQYPADDNCFKEKNLEIKFGFQNLTVPAYVWTYLKSNDNLNKDFVIVGFNSPYAEYFSTKSIIFCPDICSEIPWLKEISGTFRYAYAGIMFCCSTDFIRQTNYLQGFPVDSLLSQRNAMAIEVSTSKDLVTESNMLDI